MTDSREVGAIVAELYRAGLVTTGKDAEGHETWTLTAKGAEVGRQLALNEEAGAAVLTALLDAVERADVPDVGGFRD
jgi:hypothetical protein